MTALDPDKIAMITLPGLVSGIPPFLYFPASPKNDRFAITNGTGTECKSGMNGSRKKFRIQPGPEPTLLF